MIRFRWKREHTVLMFILAVSTVLNIYGMNRGGFGNAYYAAAVKSMLMNWHNFFYNSFDPGGFITIDKPPVGFWIQALFAWVLGFHGWSLLLPQAIAGVLSVALLYHLVNRVFGPVAGLIAAAILAVTPIAVAVDRTNEVDGMLTLAVLLAIWCLWKAVETRKLRWLLWAAVVEGIAFNIKMMEAYLVLPVFYVFYYAASNLPWRKKLLHLLSMTMVLVIVSFSWPVAVDLTPANLRPYIGSTQTNSEMELIFGYNGINRLIGLHGGHLLGGRVNRGGFNARDFSGGVRGDATALRGGGFNGFGSGTGSPGVLRLFQPQLAGQVSWLLPLALLSAISLLLGMRRRRPLDRQQSGAVLWLAWVLPMAVFFSVAGSFHPYYMVMMAPGIAALAGAGLVKMWKDFQTGTRAKWFLPLALLVNLAFESFVVWTYPNLRVVLIPISVVAILIAAWVIVRRRHSGRSTRVATTLGVLSLLVAPAYWALTPVMYGVNGTMPAAGPDLASSRNLPGASNRFGSGFGFGSTNGNPVLETYLKQHYTPSPGSYLVATLNAQTAAPIILDTGLPVMAMGGFLGSDPAITVQKLEQLAQSGKLKYFLIPSIGRGEGAAATGGALGGTANPRTSGFPALAGRFGGMQSTLTTWIKAHCTPVPSSEWQAPASGSTSQIPTAALMREQVQLYEYSGA